MPVSPCQMAFKTDHLLCLASGKTFLRLIYYTLAWDNFFAFKWLLLLNAQMGSGLLYSLTYTFLRFTSFLASFRHLLPFPGNLSSCLNLLGTTVRPVRYGTTIGDEGPSPGFEGTD